MASYDYWAVGRTLAWVVLQIRVPDNVGAKIITYTMFGVPC